jgi:hypothetical protein
MQEQKEIQKFIRERSSLFWYIQEEKKTEISIDFLVEMILNYGDEKDVKRLFELFGINETARIFRHQISQNRVNYFPQVVNYFTLYFNQHAQGNSVTGTG